jgi:hypothetical protein
MMMIIGGSVESWEEHLDYKDNAWKINRKQRNIGFAAPLKLFCHVREKVGNTGDSECRSCC